MHKCLGCMEQYKDEYDICPFCGYEKDTPPLEPYHMVPGTLLNERYTVGKVVGFGGFGVTYIGYDNLLDRKVAIKEYLPGEFSTRIPGTTEIVTYEGERTAQFQKGLQKFVDEAKMLAKVQASNGIVQIYDSFLENSTAYIIMEYMEGMELSKYLENKGKLTVEEAKEILHPILLALKDVHELGIVHRDIAPNNIFLLKDGRVKLYDFGASRFVSSSHSKSLSVIVKPGYAPAEQYSSRGSQGTWTDVYSLAATFYTMITGIVPEDAMDRIEKEELKRPSKLGCKISKSVENALMNALNIKPEDRTQTVEILEKELYRDSKVKLHFVHLKKADVGKWPLWVKLAITTAIVGVVTFAGLLITGVVDYSYVVPESFELPEGMTRVPNLVNSDIVTAEALMQDAKLTIQIVDKQNSEYIPEGKVLSQNVKKGKIVHDSDVVEVVISAGREVLYMCDVLGMSRDQAIEVLFQMGVTVELQEEYSSYAAGVVMNQNVEANASIYRGDKVILTVSKGVDSYLDENQELELPDFVGMTMEEALETAGKYGIYLQSVATKVKKGKGGIIAEQSPNAGMKVKQGATIDLVLYAEPTVVRMIDVQYKDVEASVKALENLGLKVEVSYEESALVAAGKVISQSIEKDKEVVQGTTVSLVASKGQAGTNDTTTIVYQWSDWVSELPGEINASDYEIESKPQFCFRDRTTMTSSNSNEEGWTLYDTKVTKGAFGNWSAWDVQSPTVLQDREIESKKQYAYSDYETKEVNYSSESGWNLKETIVHYGEYSANWSDYSTTEYVQSDTRQVNKKTQYRYQTRSKLYTESSQSSIKGYTLYDKYVKWGDWTETTNPGVNTETYQCQYVRTVPEVSHQAVDYYSYHRYCKSVDSNYSGPDSSAGPVYDVYTSTTPLTPVTVELINGAGQKTYVTGYKVGYKTFFDEEVYYKKVIDIPAYDVYQERVGQYIYKYWYWGAYGDFSPWSFESVSETEERHVEQRTVYAYKDRSKSYTYVLERWTPYTAFSDIKVEVTATRKVITQEIYRYRDKQDVYTYYYYKWGAWSDWRDEKVESSENREVTTRKVYRYKHK